MVRSTAGFFLAGLALVAVLDGDQLGAEPPPFVDATSTTGLDFRHVSGRDGRFLFVEMNGAGVALFDADGDGDLDVFLPKATPCPRLGRPPGRRSGRSFGVGSIATT